VQPQLPPLLHEPLDQAEQPVSALPAGLDRPEVGKIKTTHRSRECLKNFFTIRIFVSDFEGFVKIRYSIKIFMACLASSD
jgi:hypothetical protein